MTKIISRKAAKVAGLRRYFTGKPCKRGHISERYVTSFGCAQCLLEREERLCAEDPEYARKRQSGRTARQKARMHRYKQDPDFQSQYNEYMRQYRRDRLDREPEWAAKIYRKTRTWFLNNPEKARSYAAKRRILISQSDEHYTADDVRELLELQNWQCAEPTCRKCLKDKYHVDHIMPITLGGHNGRSNIQCLCVTCNVRKSNKHPDEWDRMNGRKSDGTAQPRMV